MYRDDSNVRPSVRPKFTDTHPTPAHGWREALPAVFPGIAAFARRPWDEILSTIILATSGGALVSGVILPTAYELGHGRITALPYAFWGLSLWFASAGYMGGKRWPPFAWFVSVTFIIASWV